MGFPVEPFQRRIERALHGEDRELLVLLPRGNGKTTLLAAIAVHHLLTTRDPHVYVGAANTAQASILFDAACKLVRHPAYAENFVIRTREIRLADGTGHLKVVPSNGPRMHGLTPSLAICDELHAHRDDGLYLAMRTGMAKRPDALLVTITTPGPLGDSPLARVRQRALAAPHVERRGPVVEGYGAGIRLLEWSVPEEVPGDDMKWAKRVNPASWITPKLLGEQHQALPPSAWECFHMGRFSAGESSWLPTGAWQACVGEARIEPGERIWIGVDAGGGGAASVVAWVNEAGHVAVAIYEGEEGVYKVMEHVQKLASQHVVVEVSYDPWHFGGVPALDLERAGLRMVEFRQTNARMCPASARLREAIMKRRLLLPDDPTLADHAAKAIAKDVSGGGWRLDKLHRGDKIDAVIALAMAWERSQHRPEPAKFLGWL